MDTYVVLLRGVTPTGRNKVLMAPLRANLERAGLEDVRTYIQSGNVIVRSDLDRMSLENLVHRVIAETSGGDISVLARTADEARQILRRNPFADADTSKLYFTVLSAVPTPDVVEDFLSRGYAPDKVAVIEDAVYLQCSTKYSDARASNNFIERKLHVTGTTRNFNTLSKLVALAAQADAGDAAGSMSP